MYATGSATGNNVANLTIPSSTRLKGLQYAISIDSITDNAQIDLELSKSSATEIAVNGSQQCVGQVSLRNNLLTSGMGLYGHNQFVPVDVQFVQGQIIYLHAVVVGTITYYFTCLLWLSH